ncbi:MAG TPA: ABC transporter permease [Bryobacteraceae bacterium]|jgi:predicted permease
MRIGTGLEAIWTDLRHSVRGLRRNFSLSILGTAMLALGMGASIAMFSIVQSALLKPLPFRDSARILELWETRQERGIDQASFSEANFWDVRAQNHSFKELAAYHYGEANLTGAGPAEKVSAVSVTAGFFRTLGVSPVLGRDFSYRDDRGGWNNSVAIAGNRFWRTHFGGDPGILGRTLRLNGRAYTVIGVLPPGEPWLTDQLYLPFGYRAGVDRGSWEFQVIGRLAPGVSPAAARADFERLASILGRSYPKEDKGIGFRLESSSTWVATDTARRGLWLLFGAVTFLLFIACLNIANLLLARGTAREREIAVRTALGAGRARLMRFVMMEALVLSVSGAAIGVVLADAAVHTIQALEIRGIPRLADAAVNPWVFGFAALIAVLTGVLSGLAPALYVPSTRFTTALREGARQTGSRGQGRLRAALVSGEVALSFLLLIGAGLLIRSFIQLTTVNPGFQTQGRLWFSVSMPDSYWEKGTGKRFLDRFFERLSVHPNVIAAGGVSNRPVEGGDPGMTIDSSFRPQASGPAPWAGWRIVSPGYFRAIGLPLLRGRVFDENDKPVWGERGQPAPPRRVILSERLAKLIFPNQDPVGKHATLWKGQSNWNAEVVGIVADSRERGLASGSALTVYLPSGSNALTTEIVVHTRTNPLSLVPVVRSMVASFDPSLPVADVRSFQEVVRRSVAPERFNVILLGVFSGFALLLATAGIYGVLSYSMSRRTAEIGLRVALGASRGNILRMAFLQGLRPALLGILLGALGAWWLSRYIAALLFGTKPFEPLIYFAVALLLFITALAACYLPGRRAMRIDPAEALRIE